MGVEGDVLKQAIALHQKQDYNGAARLYNALLNRNPFDEGLLFLLGDLYLRAGHNGLAINLLSALLQFNRKHGEAWCNLGIAYRKEERIPAAISCWEEALKIQGETPSVCANMSTLYADHGDPEQALHWIERALKVDPNMTEAHWQRGLSLLTMRRWAEGWPEYEYRFKLDHFDTRQSIDVPRWDFSPTEHLYVHGEQGIGDEVMFLSCLDEILPLAKRVTLECHRSLETLCKATWPKIDVITEPQPGDYTAKVAMGSLAVKLRQQEENFPGVAYLKPALSLVEHYRAELRKLGPPPYIALAWYGGTKETRNADRSITLEDLNPFRLMGTCVSGQYEHTNHYVAEARAEHGLVKIDDDCIGRDIHAQAALFKAVDAVVTVQQTAVHVAGAVGAACYALINPAPHWRYGLSGDLPWYNSVRLYRKRIDEEWSIPIEKARSDFADQHTVRAAQCAYA